MSDGTGIITGGRIIIADDHAGTRRVLADLLRTDGWTVFEARDGVELLSLAELHLPHAAVSDLSMPRMGGLEAARTLRRRPAFGSRRLIAITARQLTAGQKRQIGLVFDHLIEKPVRPSALRLSLTSVANG